MTKAPDPKVIARAREAAAPKCKWRAAGHDETCMDVTRSAFWCLACQNAYREALRR